ncbi:recombinase family protein [Xanthomonas euvesicatoria]|uniref:recombinase family protein n=1 Tax=Xanthomonas euvesicatoria TaxID=456327 RepID=UPI00321A58E4
MLIGYARVSKADGSQSLDLQHDALRAAGVERDMTCSPDCYQSEVESGSYMMVS